MLAIAVGLLGLLGWLATAPPPDVPLPLAAEHEGAGPVRVEGTATDVRRDDSGRLRFRIEQGGYALDVRAPPAAVEDGLKLQTTGRLLRSSGQLTLFVESPDDLVLAPVAAAVATWSQVAADPASYGTTPIQLDGTADATSLRDGEGHRILQGKGEWLRGAVRATGTLRYDEACICHRFDALEVTPWTP